ncbi:helix-turn-helix domain-containing protein [Paracidobacterium acidisoli]|uniref:AraC family transcriptional regulator n=1 Tax=Paracidobacterium acidisoli TaxID=2303751 RepID=A0A372INZ6_9BACT|nr:AraC family transcriptional regulator [Paracidobacterium acidisoli]MBT9330900.1 AraC family transcriptional regulator [Paracidobacterium acidisoli]
MSRISVIRDDQVVPLLPGKPASGTIFSPWNGLIVEKHSIPGIEIPEHEHSSLCLHMQTSDPVQMEWWSEGKNGKESPGPGSLILLAPGTRDRLRWNAPSRRLIVSIDDSYLSRAARELDLKSRSGFASLWHFRDSQLSLLLTEIQREMEEGWSTGALYGDLLGMSLSVALLRKHAKEDPEAIFAKGGISKARLRRVLDFIHENSHSDLRLEDLAQVAEMSVFHFARLFRTAMGISPHRYLLRQRLRQAQSLLRLGSRTVAEIAVEAGFSSPGHLSRAFRREVGISPTEWLRRQ